MLQLRHLNLSFFLPINPIKTPIIIIKIPTGGATNKAIMPKTIIGNDIQPRNPYFSLVFLDLQYGHFLFNENKSDIGVSCFSKTIVSGSYLGFGSIYSYCVLQFVHSQIFFSLYGNNSIR